MILIEEAGVPRQVLVQVGLGFFIAGPRPQQFVTREDAPRVAVGNEEWLSSSVKENCVRCFRAETFNAQQGSTQLFGRPPEWIYHLQIALLRNLIGDRAVDRALAAGNPHALTSDRATRA